MKNNRKNNLQKKTRNQINKKSEEVKKEQKCFHTLPSFLLLSTTFTFYKNFNFVSLSNYSYNTILIVTNQVKKKNLKKEDLKKRFSGVVKRGRISLIKLLNL